MTSTPTRDEQIVQPTSADLDSPHLTQPPKLRRRPALVAGAVAAICLGGLLAAWAWTSTTDTREVLAARTTIPQGSVIEADDLQRVRVNADPALEPLPASSIDQVVGNRAALDIAAGGLLTADATASSPMPPEGKSVVGVALTPAQAPGLPLQSGDTVRVIVTPAEGTQPTSGSPEFTNAQVVGTHTDQASGQLVVDVLVPYADAGVLAARAATGSVALVLDSEAQ